MGGSLGGVVSAATGGLIGGAGGYASGKAQKKADNAYYQDLSGVRNQIRDAYADAQKGWVDYIPELHKFCKLYCR